MVKTWQTSWFGEEGTRLFYIVPSSLTDEILPLSVSPAPDEVVRVLVGRMEVLTPERGDKVRATLARLGSCAHANAEPLRSELARLGRFAEPALESLYNQESDPQRRLELSNLLAELRQERATRVLK
jgi:hypothetical protein